MGKLILVSGKNSSGKSVFAENLFAKLNCTRYYIATMIPKTDDNYTRIEKHKKQREYLGFKTLEIPYNLSDASVDADSSVLLEDVSNLLANNMFEKGKNADDVFDDILTLSEKCRVLVAVTISGLKSHGYDPDTSAYIDSINEINQKLYKKASVCVKMANNKPLYEKGDENDIY